MKLFHLILPGLLVAATGVGAGDLISGAMAGHYLGLVLWIPVAGALLKYVLTEGIARYQFATGKPLIHGWFQELGPWLKVPFILYLILWSYMVGGALINACGSAFNALIPFTQQTGLNGKFVYGNFFSLLGLALVIPGNFDVFEKIMAFLVGVMFFTVISTSFLFLNGPTEFITGLFAWPSFSFTDSWFLAVLGGVGGTLTILSYGYWIKESKREGLKGLKESKVDLMISYILTALFSMAMMVLGHQLPEVSKVGTNFVEQVSQLFSLKLGPWGAIVFKIGFFCGVFSSLLGVWQSVPYLFADVYLIHKKRKVDDVKKSRPYRYYLINLAIVPLSSLWIKFQGIQLLYAVIGAFFIPLCTVSLLVLNNRGSHPKYFKNQVLTNLILIFTFIFFVANGARILWSKF